MEGIAPPLHLLYLIKSKLVSGESTYDALYTFLKDPKVIKDKKFILYLRQWFDCYCEGSDSVAVKKNFKSIYRKSLIDLLELGLEGYPIVESLSKLEVKIIEAMDSEIELKIKKMPIYALMPLMFLQFPSLLILGFIPFFEMFTSQLGG